MDTENLLKDEKFWTIVLGGIGCLALLWSLIVNPGDWPNVLVNFSGIGVSVIVFIVALTVRERTGGVLPAAKETLVKLQKKYNDFLLPPRYLKDDYDPEQGAGLQYLFIKKNDSKLKAKFIPLEPLAQGVMIIYVQKGSLVYGLKYSSEEATDEAINLIRNKVTEKVNGFLNNNYKEFYEVLNNKNEEAAITIDFDEEKMKKKKFIKAVYEVSELATTTLLSFKKS